MATAAVAQAHDAVRDDTWLADRIDEIRTSSPLWKNPEAHRVQVLVTRVIPDKPVSVHGFRVDAELFYPASAIKTFVAVAALRELQRLRGQDGSLSLDTPLFLCRLDDDECRLTADPTNIGSGRITLGHEIRKMQLVSSNVAFNRLYDFVGHHRLNETFLQLGFDSVRIRTRFQGGAAGGRVSPPLSIGSVRLPERVSKLPLGPAPATDTDLGKAHYDEAGKLQRRPADFRFKNYASLRSLHQLMIGLVRPELAGAPELGLEQRHRDFLIQAMQDDPRASTNPEYKGSRYDIERFKVLLRGARRAVPASELRGVSKSGRAYGFEVDNAYLEHLPSGRALFVTVAVHANPNRVINDNGYAYHLTRPLVEALGEELARDTFASPLRADRGSP
jgi:hypothetical protein